MAEPAHRNPYQAVSVRPGLDNCQAVRDLREQRFLASEAPMLPLDDCTTNGNCTCKYKRWDDRRQEDRRMIDNGIGSEYFHGEDKREVSGGRRKTD